MTMKVPGYAAKHAKEDLVPISFERREARPDDVVIEILYCGVCHSDLHTARNDWGWTTYPIVPGHEIIGRVVAVGQDVTRFKPGDPVGVGCLVDSCRQCDACASGEEQYCDGATYTYGGEDRHDHTKTQGGYSDKIVVSEEFVLRIPDGLDLKGADHIVLSGLEAQMAAVRARFDLIIDTVPYVHDLNPYLPTLATDGTLVLVGYLGGLEPFLNTTPMVLRRKSVAGSLIGGIQETQELLDFCGQHGITSDVEVIRMQDINTAFERMLKSDVKYRFVIDMASLKAK